MELQGSDNLVCPFCGYIYKDIIEDLRINEGVGINNADDITCEECNEEFLIVEYDNFYLVEDADKVSDDSDEEEEEDEEEEDDEEEEEEDEEEDDDD